MTYEIGSYVFDNWEIVREIGSGAYGKVYEIRRSDYGVTAKSALKVVRIPPSQSDVRSAMSDGMGEDTVSEYFEGFVRELIQEIQLMAELQGHPNIVSYQDHKVINLKPEIGWNIQIRMELLESLVNYQIRNKKITEQQIIKLGIDIASAVEFCEKKQVIHRDIKPDNIFVDPAGNFKLGDFGVAKAAEKTTGGHSKKGTESYMAPEIYLGRPYGKTVDIYSLGLVLYRLANQNRLPFYPLNTAIVNYHEREEALSKRMRGDVIPAPVNASSELTGIILKAVAYDPKERWQSAGELRKALEHVQSLKTLSTSGPIRFDYKETPEEDEETIGLIDKASLKGAEKESVPKTSKQTGLEKEERRDQSIKTNQKSFKYTSGVIRQEEKERYQSFAGNKNASNSGNKGRIVLLIVAACIAAGIGVFLYFSKSGITDKTNESGMKNSSTEVLFKKEEVETEKKSAAEEETETKLEEISERTSEAELHEMSDDNSLSSLGIKTEGVIVNPEFNYYTWEYDIVVPVGTKTLELYPATSSPEATLNVTGTSLADDGTGTVVITVTSESGSSFEYVLYVTTASDPINGIRTLSEEEEELSQLYEFADEEIRTGFANGDINVRATPTTESAGNIVSTLDRGEETTIIGETSNWYEIYKAEDSVSGLTNLKGFVLKRFLSDTYEEALADSLETAQDTAKTPQTSVSVSPADGPRVKMTSDANILDEASVTGNVIGIVNAGTTVTQIGSADDWVQIDYNGVQGYIKANKCTEW